jgi:hypothetical protein
VLRQARAKHDRDEPPQEHGVPPQPAAWLALMRDNGCQLERRTLAIGLRLSFVHGRFL